ncbi:MAG TPA: hypothetical protein VNY24_20105, partial [Candidatus Acidoferrales bacterium]|nr:hypothetical protein [Candidatus Acidoferrales bacterium]
AGGVAAQTQTEAQAGGQTSVEAGKAQAQGSGSASASSAASAQNGQTNASLGSGAAINAELSAPVDSKKAKPGDPVAAHTTEPAKSNGKTVIPKGAKLVGHVTQASARAKGDSESALGIVFDKAILKNGQEMPLNVAIQALASGQSAVAANAGDDMAAMGGAGGSAMGSDRAMSGGALGGVTSTTGGAAGTVTNTAAGAGNMAGGAVNSTAHSAANTAAAGQGAMGGLNAAGQLTSGSRGVFGLQGVNLSSATTSAAQGSVITSAGKNVQLASGTQMLLVTQAAGAAETPKP